MSRAAGNGARGVSLAAPVGCLRLRRCLPLRSAARRERRAHAVAVRRLCRTLVLARKVARSQRRAHTKAMRGLGPRSGQGISDISGVWQRWASVRTVHVL